ncbi:MAG: hypothetical protein PPP58_07845, partial [Natronomonas sp.]
PIYEEHELLETEMRTTTDRLLFTRPTTVVLTVGTPPGAERRGLATAVERRLAAEGIDVTVEVRYVEIERSGSSAASAPSIERTDRPAAVPSASWRFPTAPIGQTAV